ncbi:hypothetical protein E4U21_004083 [Claviceps maximensis]|nr:hypothetical protein E4U21_004083 [Claviceps maximensis]
MLSLSAISFAIATTLSGYLASRCLIPPNPRPTSSHVWTKDSIGFVGHPASILSGRLTTFGFCSLHAVVSVLLDSEAVHPPGHLNPDLFGWTWTAPLGFLSIFIGAFLRLAAFGELGSSFTFSLTKPNELNTKGIYAYIQHPSYTGLILVLFPVHLLFFRWDGWLAYVIPQCISDVLRGWGVLCSAVVISSISYALGLRVSDEEAMLKELFGKKWVAWNGRTKRFIPGFI